MTDMLAFPTLTFVRALDSYRLHLKYDDATEGEVDLAELIQAGGVFEPLRSPERFALVHVGPAGQVRWDEVRELCPDALYLEITHESLDEVVKPGRGATTDA